MMKDPNQQGDATKSNQEIDDSALMVESARDETPIYARREHRQDEYAKPILSDGERDRDRDHQSLSPGRTQEHLRKNHGCDH
jgi:hypothetical protein